MIFSVVDTEYSADSVEFCRHEGQDQFMLVGTYQVLEEESIQSATMKRKGRLYVFDTSGNNLVETFRKETAAILDIKWNADSLNAGVVTAMGETELYTLNDGKLEQQLVHHNGKVTVLNLSIDWSQFSSSIAVSQSDGSISILDVKPDSLQEKLAVHGHGFEAWITAFSRTDAHLVYSGGDDLLFRGWDVRSGAPTFTNKTHEAGVTTISSHPTLDLISTGSYDENIRIWDARNMKRPLSTTSTGGGVWRLKWKENQLLAACMYNGFFIYDMDSNHELIQSCSHQEHKSIAYGADWSPSTNAIGTCSFYDHSLQLWSRS